MYTLTDFLIIFFWLLNNDIHNVSDVYSIFAYDIILLFQRILQQNIKNNYEL